MAKEKCRKCGGNGFWCKGYHNGEPISQTGFQCWGCGGVGYIGTDDENEVYLNKYRVSTIGANIFRVELRILNKLGKREWREVVVECGNINWAGDYAKKQLGFN